MNEDQSIISQLTDLETKRAELLTAAKDERLDLLARLAGLCARLGPLVRSEIPDGILKRRERKVAKAEKPVRVRRVKAEAGA
jgi:hypothetical protein